MLTATSLSKRFPNGVAALDDLSFALNAGDFVSLLGPSGCGKSTALRLIAGLLPPDSGTITWNDNKPDIGFVFQEPTLMPWADALTNVRLPLDLKHVPRAQANEASRAALARVGLGDFAGALPRELSGGMKMRVSIARALVTRPAILLLDEPFAALDEITRFRLNDDLLALQKELAATIVFVTHSVFESVYLSSRICVFSNRPGRVMQEIVVDAPTRGSDFRASALFGQTCQQASAALERAYGLEGTT